MAELPFDHPDSIEFLNEEGHEEVLGKLADKKNDPLKRPSLPPFSVRYALLPLL